MKKLISLFTFAILYLAAINSYSQVSSYTFSQSMEPYIERSGDTIVAEATSVSGYPNDPTCLSDQVYRNNSLPFTFTFNGVNYTNIVISSSGFITFGSVPPESTNKKCIQDSGKYRGCVAGLSSRLYGIFFTEGRLTNGSNVLTNITSFSGVVVGKVIASSLYPDLPPGTTITSFDTTARTITVSGPSNHTGHTTFDIASGSITRTTVGPASARIHIIQFKNLRTFPTGLDENYNFQIWLYESSQRIEVHYGECIKNNASPPFTRHQVGLRGATNTDFNNRLVILEWAKSFPGAQNTSWCHTSNTVCPQSGQVFTWDRPIPVTTDAGVTNANLVLSSPSQILTVGKSYDLTAEVQNEGIAFLYDIPVYYKVDGGPAVGPEHTVGPVHHNQNEDVLFTGSNKFTPTTPGVHRLKFYTSLPGDQIHFNDSLEINVTVQQKITEFPYFQTFENPVNWTQVEEFSTGQFPLWRTALSINPNNEIGTSVTSNFFACESGRREILRSPVMDISGLVNPALHFYIAYQNVLTREDSVEIVISTDGGATFFSASTVYNKTFYSVPSLSTVIPATSDDPFYPLYHEAWRYETISLANITGANEVVIGFRGKSGNGGSAWIDNVVVSGSDSFCENIVTGLGTYNCNSTVSVTFNAMPSPHQTPTNKLMNHSDIKKVINPSNDKSGPIVSQKGNVNVLSNIQTDNPGGGVLSISEHIYDASVTGSGIAVNDDFSSAPDGSIFTPDVVYQDFWYACSYTGNDYTGYTEYDISFDISSISYDDPNRIYIVKRADRSGKWKAVSTTYSAGKLSVHDMNTFCEYALAGDSISNPLPVELTNFTSLINGRNVSLNWATASEINNSGFDIERSRSIVNGEWSMIEFVHGYGTSSTMKNYSFTDRNLATGKYKYRLKQKDFNGNFEYFNLSNEVNIGVPSKFELSQNYPNPFNPSTKINYDLPFDSKVNIKLYDISGREVATIVNEVKTAGYYSVDFNATSGGVLSSGIYFYRIFAETNGNNFTATKKMMLVK